MARFPLPLVLVCCWRIIENAQFSPKMNIVEAICDSRPDDAEISRFEGTIGAALPESYRAFLRTHNGGQPKPSTFSFMANGGERENDSVQYFFGLHSGRIGSSEKKLAIYRNRIPDDFFPIGTDSFGNLLLMATGNESHGKIYFWDHEQESEPPTLKNISLIETSFAAFIASLSAQR